MAEFRMKDLSTLQKSILRLGLLNRRDEGRDAPDEDSPDVFNSEVLVWCYGWKPDEKDPADTSSDRRWVRENAGPHFDRTKIGKRKYQTAACAVSRSLTRLEKKGLVDRVQAADWSGCDLTAAGLAVARVLKGEERDSDH